MDQIIKDYYYDPSTGYIGANKLYRKLKKKYPLLTLKDVNKVLSKQKVVQVNKKVSSTGSFVPPYAMFQFQIDLIYLNDSKLNKASYGLTCIDTFSKKANVILMKRKTDQETVDAMTKMFDIMGVPEQIYVDEGSEFTNKKFKKLLDSKNVELVLTLRHAPVVERFNRTIKEMLHKYLQATNSKTITNVLPKVVKNYNNNYHKSIGMAPNEVNNDVNEGLVWVRLNELAIKRNRPIVTPGDKVRVMIKERAFEKKYTPRFSKQIYTVTARRGRYYYVSGAARDKYLRAYIQKVGDVEDPIIKPDLEGTQEGRLKKMSKMPTVPNPAAKTLNINESIAKTKGKRTRKKVTKLDL